MAHPHPCFPFLLFSPAGPSWPARPAFPLPGSKIPFGCVSGSFSVFLSSAGPPAGGFSSTYGAWPLFPSPSGDCISGDSASVRNAFKAGTFSQSSMKSFFSAGLSAFQPDCMSMSSLSVRKVAVNSLLIYSFFLMNPAWSSPMASTIAQKSAGFS